MSMESETYTVVVTRRFDAPVERVWQAWSEPEIVKQWWGPTGFTCPKADMEFREGGTSLVCMRAPQEYGGGDLYNTWTYNKIVPNQSIEFVQHFTDANGVAVEPSAVGIPPGVPSSVRHIISFRRVGENQTEMTVTEYGYTLEETRDLSSMGMEQCIDKMAAALAETKMSDQTQAFEMKLEVVPLPVADVDRAKAFYAEKIGFNVDHDSYPSEGVRVVQLTPHGSGCSVVIGTGLGAISEMIPGSIKGLHLVVKDVAALRDHLLAKGVAVGEIIEYPRGIKFAHFSDPDGNSWALQEIPPGL